MRRFAFAMKEVRMQIEYSTSLSRMHLFGCVIASGAALFAFLPRMLQNFGTNGLFDVVLQIQKEEELAQKGWFSWLWAWFW